MPLAGVWVTLNGHSVVMGEHGRFVSYAVEPEMYSLTAVLPDGLSANIGPVVVTEERDSGCICWWWCNRSINQTNLRSR